MSSPEELTPQPAPPLALHVSPANCQRLIPPHCQGEDTWVTVLMTLRVQTHGVCAGKYELKVHS